MGTKVRVLCAINLDGVAYAPDQVVDLPAATAKSLAAEGQVDPHKEAVAYCLKELGADVVVHVDPAEAAAARAAAIADLEARLAAAPEADKPALEAELAALKGE